MKHGCPNCGLSLIDDEVCICLVDGVPSTVRVYRIRNWYWKHIGEGRTTLTLAELEAHEMVPWMEAGTPEEVMAGVQECAAKAS